MALMWRPHRFFSGLALFIGLAATASGFILGVYGAGEIGEGNGLGWPITVGAFVLVLVGFLIGRNALSTPRFTLMASAGD